MKVVQGRPAVVDPPPSAAEAAVIKMIRDLEYGEVRVVVNGGRIILADQKHTHRFDLKPV